MMSMLNAAAPVLFPGVHDSVFSAVRVGDYLFDGVTLHCADAAGTTAALVCSLLPSYAPPTIRPRINSSDFLYSFLAHVRIALNTIITRYKLENFANINYHYNTIYIYYNSERREYRGIGSLSISWPLNRARPTALLYNHFSALTLCGGNVVRLVYLQSNSIS